MLGTQGGKGTTLVAVAVVALTTLSGCSSSGEQAGGPTSLQSGAISSSEQSGGPTSRQSGATTSGEQAGESTSMSSSERAGGPTSLRPDANPSGESSTGPTSAGGRGGSGATEVSPGRTATGVPGAPTRLVMPAINFDKPLAALGLNGVGEINPPAGTTQWYDKSVKPGQAGISVIAGHVRSGGPDVFYNLSQLDPGDVVTVEFGDGTARRFKVYDKASVNKKQLQTDARVWGTSTTPVLALITCDSGSQIVGDHYVSNYVVWAAPV